jgi:hypothetical protein
VAAVLDPAGELPGDPLGRANMRLRVPRTVERLAELEQQGLWRVPASVHDALDAARGLPAPVPSALVHGDLHIRHLLVDENCGPTGVIDWADICRGDPAIDLPLFWSLLPAGGRTEFLDAYGTVTDAQLLRARVLAVFLSATLAVYAHHEAMPNLEREAVAALERAAADCRELLAGGAFDRELRDRVAAAGVPIARARRGLQPDRARARRVARQRPRRARQPPPRLVTRVAMYRDSGRVAPARDPGSHHVPRLRLCG